MYSSDAIVAALIVAAIALSEGVRRLGGDALILRRGFRSQWQLARNTNLGSGLHVVALFIPFVLPVVVQRDSGDAAARFGLRRLMARLKSRGRRLALELGILRVSGALVLAGLVVGVPFATFQWGIVGFLAGVGTLLALGVFQSVMTCRALERAGASRGGAALASLKLVWPFNAPLAAEMVQTQVVAEVPPLAVSYLLLGEEAFLNAFRERAYDALRGGSAGEDDALLFQLCPRPTFSSFLETPPIAAAGDPFCPRCAAIYRKGTPSCSDCDVALEGNNRS